MRSTESVAAAEPRPDTSLFTSGLRLDYLNRISHVEADYTNLKADMGRAEAAARATEKELRLRSEASEKRVLSADRKLDRLRKELTEARMENDTLRSLLRRQFLVTID